MSSPSIQESASRMHCHPLQLLKEDDIKTASSILLGHLRNLGDSTGLNNPVHFKNISLHDPPKALLLPHLEAEASGVPLDRRPYVPRCVDIIWSTENGREVRESTISLDSKSIIAQTHGCTAPIEIQTRTRRSTSSRLYIAVHLIIIRTQISMLIRYHFLHD